MAWGRTKPLKLAEQAGQLLAEARTAMYATNDMTAAGDLLERCDQLAQQALVADPGLTQVARGRAAALYDLAEVRLAENRFQDAVTACETAAGLYARPDLSSDTRRLVADVRIRQARAFSELGAELSAIQGAQAAVATYVLLDGSELVPDDYASLTRVLALAAPIFARYGSSLMALQLAREANSKLITMLNTLPDTRHTGTYRYLAVSLQVEIDMLRALGQESGLSSPLGAARHTLGPDWVAQALAAPTPKVRPGLLDAVRAARGSGRPTALENRLTSNAIIAYLPGFLVDPDHVMTTAVDAHAVLVALRDSHRDLALVAGLTSAAILDFVAWTGAWSSTSAARSKADLGDVLVDWSHTLTQLEGLVTPDGPLANDLRRQSTEVMRLINTWPLSKAAWARLTQGPPP